MGKLEIMVHIKVECGYSNICYMCIGCTVSLQDVSLCNSSSSLLPPEQLGNSCDHLFWGLLGPILRIQMNKGARGKCEKNR